VFDGRPQERLDELLQHDLARHGLRDSNHRGEV
jgi:hypothetical protein